MRIIRVEWIDAALHAEWTLSHEDANVQPVETVGFLLNVDKRVLKIAQSNCGGIRFGAIQSIPRAMIQRIDSLTASRKKR